MREGYKDSWHVYCLRYKITPERLVNSINSSDGYFLPFPCIYTLAFPSSCISYCFKINHLLKEVKESLTQITCCSTQCIGRNFIRGAKSFNCTPEFWSYLNFLCRDIVTKNGQFQTKRKRLQMRSLIDLSATQEFNIVEIMHFESIAHLNHLDIIFGKFARYSTQAVKPFVGGFTAMRRNDQLATMGTGI